MLDWLKNNLHWIIMANVCFAVILGTVAYLILLERKTASWVQDRIGPNRVGLGFGLIPWLKDKKMWGLGQPLADGLKFLLKEDYRAKGVDKVLFSVAPAVMIGVVIISIAVLPWGGWKGTVVQVDVTGQGGYGPAIQAAVPPGTHVDVVSATTHTLASQPGREFIDVVYNAWPFQIANLNIGVLFALAALSLAVYGVVIGGWASNNKYSFLGGLRATANMISYEIPLGLSVLTIVVMFGSLNLDTIVTAQAHYWAGAIPAWNVFAQPLGFVMFLICIHAEANRAPFDLAEAEQELVGGYHTEYSSMRFALFFLAEYLGMIVTSTICVALFFGGWHLPWVDKIPGLGPWLQGTTVATPEGDVINVASIWVCGFRALVFFTKTLLVVFVFMWVRWSLPRFRFDQLMMLAWRALIPISLALLMATAVVMWWLRADGRPFDLVLSGSQAVALLVVNVALFAVTMGVSLVLPPAPLTNRKVNIPNSRFRRTPVPGTGVRAPAVAAGLREAVKVDAVPAEAGTISRG